MLISFEAVIARNYKSLHGITQFCTEVQSDGTALDQSESSNFFHVYDLIKLQFFIYLVSLNQFLSIII